MWRVGVVAVAAAGVPAGCAGARVTPLVEEAPDHAIGPAWSPDDRWLLVTAGDDGEEFDLAAVHLEDGAVRRLVDTGGDERYGRWIPRGSPWLTVGGTAPDR